MKIAILGTGAVGQTLASRLSELGYEVTIGTGNVSEKLSDSSKDKRGNPPFSEWYKSNNKVRLATFADAAEFGEMVVNATNGVNSLTVLKQVNARDLKGKVLVDVANPLDFSKGMPPSLLDGLHNTTSLGEEIQNAFPETKVVKTLNTIWCGLMVNPGMLGKGDHTNFISGNDPGAKQMVKKILIQFGWSEENIIDLGDISAARAAEAFLPLWVRLLGVTRTGLFNLKLVVQK